MQERIENLTNITILLLNVKNIKKAILCQQLLALFVAWDCARYLTLGLELKLRHYILNVLLVISI